MPSFRITFRILLLALATWTAQAWAVDGEPRLALLIGNGAYNRSPLANAVNDVRLMDATLRQVGFQVIKAENASRRDMQRLIRDFGERLKQSGGVGLFYFAGHGMQVRGVNYLLPVDADIQAEDEIAYDAVDAQSILDKMESARNRVNLLILDACRDNPFNRSRSTAAGLATMTAPSGSIVAYATAPGSVASDGRGSNGLYTKHLASTMLNASLPVEEVFKQVRSAVRRESNGQQTPWENTALEGQFYFRAPTGAPAPERVASPEPPPPDRGATVALARERPQLAAPAPLPAPARSAALVVVKDQLTGRERKVSLGSTVLEGGAVQWSTGDVVAPDGQVVSIRLGEGVYSAKPGSTALWKVPLVPGAEGKTRIVAEDGNGGEIAWKTVAASDGSAEVEAKLVMDIWQGRLVSSFPSRGTWTAKYKPGIPIPSSTALEIRGVVGGFSSGVELTRTELQGWPGQ